MGKTMINPIETFVIRIQRQGGPCQVKYVRDEGKGIIKRIAMERDMGGLTTAVCKAFALPVACKLNFFVEFVNQGVKDRRLRS